MTTISRHLRFAIAACASAGILAACGARAPIGPGGVDPLHPLVTHDQVVTHFVAGIPTSKVRTVAILDRLACAATTSLLTDSATITSQGGYVSLTDGVVERARLEVDPGVVGPRPVTYRLTLHPHSRFFEVEASRSDESLNHERYRLVLRPPCPPSGIPQRAWLVRTSAGPVGDPIAREPGTAAGEMRFTLSRLSRFVISH